MITAVGTTNNAFTPMHPSNLRTLNRLRWLFPCGETPSRANRTRDGQLPTRDVNRRTNFTPNFPGAQAVFSCRKLVAQNAEKNNNESTGPHRHRARARQISAPRQTGSALAGKARRHQHSTASDSQHSLTYLHLTTRCLWRSSHRKKERR